MDEHDPLASDRPVDEGDALDHLWNAAHEMLRAMRTVLDAADEFVASQRNARPTRDARDARDAHGGREGRVHHIDIDGRADDGAFAEGAASVEGGWGRRTDAGRM
jgi:hypothetical protein